MPNPLPNRTIRHLVDFCIEDSKSADDTEHTVDRIIGTLHATLSVEHRAEIRATLERWETTYGSAFPAGVR